MIPVSTLYDEYIDRRKLTEQKNPFEYIVPPPQEGRNKHAKNYTNKNVLFKSTEKEGCVINKRIRTFFLVNRVKQFELNNYG